MSADDVATLARVDLLLDRIRQVLDEIDDASYETGGLGVWEYAIIMITRLTSTFEATVLLLKGGYTDEAVVLIRRLFESGIRLQYLAQNPEDSESLFAGQVLKQDEDVLQRINSLIDVEGIPEPARERARDVIGLREERYENQLAAFEEQGVLRKPFPNIRELTEKLSRDTDLIDWSSTSDVAHSAVSGITPKYLTQLEDGIVQVERTYRGLTETAAFARSAVPSVTVGIASALNIIGLSDVGGQLARRAVVIEKELISLSSTGTEPQDEEK